MPFWAVNNGRRSAHFCPWRSNRLVPQPAVVAAHQRPILAQIGFVVTLTASQFRAELLLTPLFISHPRTHLKWRLMADVLIVIASQFSHPVAKFVLMETDYVPFHP
jgi:hypothetical protein